MNKKILLTLLSFFVFVSSALAADKIRMVTSTSTLASIAGEITGDNAQIHYVASPRQDIHFIQPTPKDVLKVKKADVFIHGGLDLETWREPLLIAAGNPKLLGDSKHSIDTSSGILLLEVPQSISRAEGDIHLYGNPHFWLDPENGKQIAKNIADGLSELYPEEAADFHKNAEAFILRLDKKIKDWKERLQPFEGEALLTYHNSWPYFTRRFGLKVAGQLEPKPGIPPTAKHLQKLLQIMKEQQIKVIVEETFREKKTAEKIAKETGAVPTVFLQSVNEKKEAGDYIALFEYNVAALEKAFS